MPQQDTSEIKEKIMKALKEKGPSFPARIASEINSSTLFTSAFLSELLGEKRIKTSNLKVGSSPLYFVPGQESKLENFSEHIKGKEKEAFDLLKENSFLKDSEQEPAIRVALRSIKDFAVPFRKNDELFWRYFTVPESEFKKEESVETKEEMPEPKKEDNSEKEEEKPKEELVEKEVKEKVEERNTEEKPNLDIFDGEKQEEKPVKKTAKKTTKKSSGKSSGSRKNEKFLEKVREFLSKSSVEIKSIEGIRNDELMLIIKVSGEDRLLAAYNKKRITEKEIMKAAKKAKELGLKYSILSLGELPKKVSELIDALNDMKDIGKIE